MSHNRDLSAAAAQIGFHSSNIGIGSEAPRYPLDVYDGNLLVSGSSAGNLILEDRGVGDSSRPFHVVSSDGGKFVINRSNRNASGTTTSSVNSLTLSSSGNLGLGPQTNPTSNIHIADLSANGYELKISGNALQFNRSSNSYIDQLHDTGSILFRMTSSNTEAMRITSDRRIGINDSGPDFHLDVDGNIGIREGQVLTWHDGSGNKAGDMYMDSSDNFVIRNTSSVAERLRITSNGNIGVGGITSPSFTTGGGIHLKRNYGIGFGDGSNGRPDFQLVTTAGSTLDFRCGFGADTADISMTTGGNLVFASGGGIDFSANSNHSGVTSEVLDDYEEGTSTVSLQNMTADTNQVLMKYTKIGNVVCIVGVITLVNITVSSGSNAWFHLPFAPSHHSTSVPGASIQKNSINTNVAYLGFYGSNTNMYFMSRAGGYTSGNQLSAGQIGFTVTYNTN